MTEEKDIVRYVMPKPLSHWAKEVLVHFGFCSAAAQATADMLVEADVHGLQSHGVSISLPRYLILLERKLVNKNDEVTVVQETPTTALLDGRDNLGAIVAEKAIDILLDKARSHNSAWVSVHGSNHIGFLAHWCRKIVAHDMIGFVYSISGPEMAIHGCRHRSIGNNPISIGAPGKPFPLVLDMSSSSTAMGKVRAAALKGQQIPTGMAMDIEGNPTNAPQAVLDGGALLPSGGHKGSGIAVMVDVLCGLLSGANVHPHREGVPTATGPLNVGHLFGAIRVDSFCPIDTFHSRVEQYIQIMHSLPRLPGVERIYLPGEIEYETAQTRRSQGIPLSAEHTKVLRDLGQKYNCPLP